LIATLEPAFTAIWAYFLLNEVLTGTQLFGGLLVLMGVVLLRFGEK
jgi:drug/metabolite transporter (DMT)-like permease